MKTTTRLDPNFLTAVLLIHSFKHRPIVMAQAALLHIALCHADFTAADIPAEVTGGSRHLAGAATGALIAQGLIVCTGRVKSPHENAKGRKLDLLRLAPSKRSTVITWLANNGLPTPAAIQQELALA